MRSACAAAASAAVSAAGLAARMGAWSNGRSSRSASVYAGDLAGAAGMPGGQPLEWCSQHQAAFASGHSVCQLRRPRKQSYGSGSDVVILAS